MSRKPTFPIVKKCSKCLEYKQLDEFYKDNRSKLGLRADCKDCVKKTKLEWYHRNKAGA
jgi:hypothetical protein